jgi:hypothetical protein
MIRRLTVIWPATPAAPIAAAHLPTPAPAAKVTHSAPSGPPVISDLLDAMLAAERPRTRLTPVLNR